MRTSLTSGHRWFLGGAALLLGTACLAHRAFAVDEPPKGTAVEATAAPGDISGTVKGVDPGTHEILIEEASSHRELPVIVDETTEITDTDRRVQIGLKGLRTGAHVRIHGASISETAGRSILAEFWHNFTHNLFKPLLLFFYMGFLVPILRVKFEFPYVIYQGLTIYLLIAIGWHGGEELAKLPLTTLSSVVGFMLVGFVLNFINGILAYGALTVMTRMRRIDKATVAGYYGSDSAGTFVTCLGVLATVHIAYDPYMPVMLAVMEIPGCLVALYLVQRLRHKGMDPAGTMPDEAGYNSRAKPPMPLLEAAHGHGPEAEAIEQETELAMEKMEHGEINGNGKVARGGLLSPKLLHEVFLNPGLYLLFGGIVVGYISGRQGEEVTRADDSFFVELFQGILCLFLLEMGMTASRKLRDLRTAGPGFIAFGLLMPNILATLGILAMHAFSAVSGIEFALGSYVLFSVLCGAASYIAVPAVQRLAIPEASPTLPLAASLGLTFSYNVTIGIPIYIEVAKAVMRAWPT